METQQWPQAWPMGFRPQAEVAAINCSCSKKKKKTLSITEEYRLTGTEAGKVPFSAKRDLKKPATNM